MILQRRAQARTPHKNVFPIRVLRVHQRRPKKGPAFLRGSSLLLLPTAAPAPYGRLRLVHVAHAAVAATSAGWLLLLLGEFGNQGFGGQHQRRDGAGVLQGSADYFSGIDDAGFHQVLELIVLRVVTEVNILRLAHFAQDDGALFASVLYDLAQRLFHGALYDIGANALILLQLQLLDRGHATHQSNAAAGHNALLDGRAGSVHSIFNAGFLFLHFSFSGSTDLDHGNSTHQLRQPLLQLLAVVVRGGLVDLAADFLYAAFDLGRLPTAFDDGGVVLVDGHFLGATQVLELDVLELQAQVLGNGLAAGEDGDILQHCLATIAEARRLYGNGLQRAAQLVDHQRGQGFAFHVLSDDQQRPAGLGYLLQQWQQVLHGADLLFVDQDVGILEHGFHALGVSDEVRREVAAIELHTLDHFELRLHGAGLFYGDHAVFADLLHGFGNDAADGLVVVGADGAHLGNHLAGDGLGELVKRALVAVAVFVQGAADGGDGLLDAALERHGIRAGSNRAHAFAINCLGEHGGGRGAVAGYVRGLAGDFAHHLRAHILQGILQFDFLGHGHAVLGNGRRPELLFDNDVAPLGAQRHLYGVSQYVDAAKNRLPRLLSVHNLLCHCLNSPLSLFSCGHDFSRAGNNRITSSNPTELTPTTGGWPWLSRVLPGGVNLPQCPAPRLRA